MYILVIVPAEIIEKPNGIKIFLPSLLLFLRRSTDLVKGVQLMTHHCIDLLPNPRADPLVLKIRGLGMTNSVNVHVDKKRQIE